MVRVLAALALMPLLSQQPAIDLRSKNFRAASELVTTAVTVRDARAASSPPSIGRTSSSRKTASRSRSRSSRKSGCR
jgi:hypothetical protein